MKKVVTGLVFTLGLMAAPSISEASLGETILNSGSTGDDVQTVQEEMNEHTSHSLTIDGIYGPKTREAVISFQEKNDLQVDGIVGPETAGSLNSGSDSSSSESGTEDASSSGSTDSGSSVLRNGDSGEAVSDLQAEMNELTSHSLTVDGIYGPKTESAVTSFQQHEGISVDGVAGPETFGAMDGAESSGGSSSGSSEASSSDSSSSENSGSNDTATSSSGGTVESLISEAESHMGTPYSWGGDQPGAMDSSGFITYTFSQIGIDLPRTHAEYYHHGTDVSSPQRGDVVFFETYQEGPSHAGIYLGNNEFIHASSSQGVTVDSMSNSYWEPRYIGAKRFH